MQNILVGLSGDVEEVVEIILDAYALPYVPLLSPVASIQCHVLLYCLKSQMLTAVFRVFTHEEHFFTRQPLSDLIFGQYTYAHALETQGLNIDISTYPSPSPLITTGAPVPSGS